MKYIESSFLMSRVGKILSVTVLIEEHPQMWKQDRIVGLVVHEDREEIKIMNGEATITISKKQILETFEES